LRETAKTYQAVTFDEVQQYSGKSDLPLICDRANCPKQMVDHERGKKALTHWRGLERNTFTTELELKPVTDRSHHLRVHNVEYAASCYK